MPQNPSDLTPEEASAEAIHKAKNAAQAVELARELQLQKTVEETAQRTKESVLEALKEVFGNKDSEDPEQMKVLVHRIPILCIRIDTMDKNIEDMRGDIRWAVRLVVGAVITGVLAMLFVK